MVGSDKGEEAQRQFYKHLGANLHSNKCVGIESLRQGRLEHSMASLTRWHMVLAANTGTCQATETQRCSWIRTERRAALRP